MLRPFVEQQWAQSVARMNKMPRDRLRGFLFGGNRARLEPVRTPLHELQSGSCFYCGKSANLDKSQIDHFIPWSRHPDDGLDNLVLAHARCNNDKRDYLAAASHIRRWRDRRDSAVGAIEAIAHDVGWDPGLGRTLGAARALYLQLPSQAPLWSSVGRFDLADPRQRQGLLA